MIKWMLTIQCNRQCEYCITKNIKSTECLDLKKCKEVLEKIVSSKVNSIMLTGGEPTLSKQFEDKLLLANEIFDNVFITTQNGKFLESSISRFVKGIVFSLHDVKSYIPDVHNVKIPIYGSVLTKQVYLFLPAVLQMKGYNGLTINEDQRGNEDYDIQYLLNLKKTMPALENFSIKLNKRGHCMNETIILPDMNIINDFRPYLYEREGVIVDG